MFVGSSKTGVCSLVFLCSRREDAERVFGRWQEEVSLGPIISLQLSGVAALALGHQVTTLTPPTSHHHQLFSSCVLALSPSCRLCWLVEWAPRWGPVAPGSRGRGTSGGSLAWLRYMLDSHSNFLSDHSQIYRLSGVDWYLGQMSLVAICQQS